MGPGLNLAIFDVDGTLTDTNDVDSRCYFDALWKEFNVAAPANRFHHFTSSTNLGILHEVFETQFERTPQAHEIESFLTRLLSCLELEGHAKPSDFQEIVGAKDMLDILVAHAGWRVAIATGAFSESARLKLKKAGLTAEDIPIASCEDAMQRTDILRAVIKMAERHYGVSSFERVVFIADAEWDVIAAKTLQMPFIGVHNEKKEELEKMGVGHVVADYTDAERMLRLLLAAVPPR